MALVSQLLPSATPVAMQQSPALSTEPAQVLAGPKKLESTLAMHFLGHQYFSSRPVLAVLAVWTNPVPPAVTPNSCMVMVPRLLQPEPHLPIAPPRRFLAAWRRHRAPVGALLVLLAHARVAVVDAHLAVDPSASAISAGMGVLAPLCP